MLSDDAAYAVNWRTVLAVDALMGVLVAGAGAYLLSRAVAIAGTVLVVAGTVYVGLIARRYRRWRGLRHAAGLG